MPETYLLPALDDPIGDYGLEVHVTEDGIQVSDPNARPLMHGSPSPRPELVQALLIRGSAHWPGETIDVFGARVLTVPRSSRWREAVSGALDGEWCSSLVQSGYLPSTALGALREEARALHRQLVPLWRRRTRHGRVLSLDADLGDGLSLHDLVAADVDLLSRTTGGVFEDERLNRILRALDPAERAVVFAYAEGEGTTWTEAATAAGALDPEALGERVRRKAKRLAAEQNRRVAQTKVGIAQKSLPVGREPGTER
ncbi:hypothetical protein [Streptomyces chromofuscus]|uniref:hypothetical protein n=1 Tax=Streptomyces chromofuscus TaxID=42881 RepID=UPI0016785097|nr:hypothetical protein [Streptomyces chromofuscus]GGT44386.1 hypothetical protein GCM10010254_74390 [Streptomyces chromofuscus]